MTDPETNPTNEPAAPAEPAGEKDELGDAGKKAIQTEREARKAAETKAREAQDRAAQLERAETRRQVAEAKGLTPEQAEFLAGDDEAAMSDHADKLLAAFTAEDKGADLRRTPQVRLKPGAAPGAAEPVNYGNLAESIRSNR